MAETLQYIYEQLSPQFNVLVVINNELYNLTEQYARNIVDTRLMTLTKIDNFMPTTNVNPPAAPVNYITVATVPHKFLGQPIVPNSNLRMQLELEKQFNEYSFKMLMANETQCFKGSPCEDVDMSCPNDLNETQPTDQKLTVHQQIKLNKMSETYDI